MALSCVFSDLSAGFWQSRTRGGAAVRVVGFYRCLCNVAIASVHLFQLPCWASPRTRGCALSSCVPTVLLSPGTFDNLSIGLQEQLINIRDGENLLARVREEPLHH